jgi:uroporphyrinogen decarboxylase
MLTEREVALMAYRHQKTPWVPATIVCQDTCIPSAVKAGSRNYGYSTDWLGVKYLHLEGQPSSMPIESEAVIKDIENWRDYIRFPDLGDIDWERYASKDTAGWDRKNKLNSLILINGLFESLHMCYGIENTLCALLMYPDEVKDFLEAMADHQIRVIRNLAKYYKPDKIQFHDDYGNAKNAFMNPDTWRELIKPSLKRIIDATHEEGIIYEHHSCGYVIPFMEDFIELGIDAWNPVQFFNDPYALQKKYGEHLCFVGGFDDHITNNPFSTEEEVRATLERSMREMADGGSWIAAPAFIANVGYRNRIWLDVLDDWNRPLMAKYGVEPEQHDYERLCNTLFRKYNNDD